MIALWAQLGFANQCYIAFDSGHIKIESIFQLDLIKPDPIPENMANLEEFEKLITAVELIPDPNLKNVLLPIVISRPHLQEILLDIVDAFELALDQYNENYKAKREHYQKLQFKYYLRKNKIASPPHYSIPSNLEFFPLELPNPPHLEKFRSPLYSPRILQYIEQFYQDLFHLFTTKPPGSITHNQLQKMAILFYSYVYEEKFKGYLTDFIPEKKLYLTPAVIATLIRTGEFEEFFLLMDHIHTSLVFDAELIDQAKDYLEPILEDQNALRELNREIRSLISTWHLESTPESNDSTI